jgi:hypothetical protein
MIRHSGSPAPSRTAPLARRGGACLLGLCCLAACQDSPTDPLAALVAEETAPAVEIEIALPSLPELAASTATEDQLVRPLLDWTRSREAEDGQEVGERAVAQAAPVLAAALGPGGVASALAPLHHALRSLEGLEHVPAGLEPRLDDIRAIGRASREALEAGRLADALRDGLLASDRLRDVGPEAVARALIARGESALARTGEGGPAAPAEAEDVDRRRGVQMLHRARRALEAGDYPLALQRAFYACQLVERASSH